MTDQYFTLTTRNISTKQTFILPEASSKNFVTLFASDSISPRRWTMKTNPFVVSLRIQRKPFSEAYLAMIASESLLSRDWDQPEEDEAWMDL